MKIQKSIFNPLIFLVMDWNFFGPWLNVIKIIGLKTEAVESDF